MSNVNVVAEEFRQVGLADELRQHILVARQWFYTLPLNLLDGLERIPGKQQWDAERLSLDQALARAAESIPGCVGFRDSIPIVDGILRPPVDLRSEDPVVEAFLKECLQAGHCKEDFRETAGQRSLSFLLPAQGYLGWLWTNRTFRSEFQQLAEQYAILFADGLAPPQAVRDASAVPATHPQRCKPGRQATAALQAFCTRWRLQQVAGTASVVPLAVHVPSPLPQMQAFQAQSSGSLVYFPDIAPLPDRDELRQLLEENVRHSAQDAAHLQEWIELIRADTQGKKSIAKFARWYPLQHYCRVLFSRHGEMLVNCQNKLSVAFGEFLHVSEDTIERDLREIGRRLGDKWHEAAPVPVFAD